MAITSIFLITVFLGVATLFLCAWLTPNEHKTIEDDPTSPRPRPYGLACPECWSPTQRAAAEEAIVVSA